MEQGRKEEMDKADTSEKAPEKAENLHNINNQIIWAIMHKEYVFERRFFWMAFHNVLLMGA